MVDKSCPRVAALLRIKRGIALDDCTWPLACTRFASLRVARSIITIERTIKTGVISPPHREFSRCAVVMRISIAPLPRTAIPQPSPFLSAQLSTRALSARSLNLPLQSFANRIRHFYGSFVPSHDIFPEEDSSLVGNINRTWIMARGRT